MVELRNDPDTSRPPKVSARSGRAAYTSSGRDALDDAVEVIVVDAYGEGEQYTAFLTVIEVEVRLPA